MLDIATLLVSMGLQEEMKEVRQEGVFVDTTEEEAGDNTMMSSIAETASEALATVEESLATAAENFIPTYEMVSDAMPTAAMPLTIDLSLPASSSSSSSVSKKQA